MSNEHNNNDNDIANEVTRMQDSAEKLLKAAEIQPDRDVIRSLESWLGLDDDDAYEGLTVEDCLPLKDAVYKQAIRLFCIAWDPDAKVVASTVHHHSSSSSSLMRNAFCESNLEPESISLDAVMPGIRATRWLRHWMELNLSGTNVLTSTGMQDDTEQQQQQEPQQAQLPEQQQQQVVLIRELLAHDTQNHAFVKALFLHIQELPSLQSQFHLYTQSLRQRNEKSHQTNDPHLRMAQYQKAQQVKARFEQEWQTHLDRLECIVGEVYLQGTTPIRRLARRLLGRVWQDFVLQSSSSAASLRQENTRATGIRMTLRVLHRILLGITTTTSSLHESYRQLLLQLLVPLHKPDAMVLWRDQTSVLELYHEPLTQCIAVLLQKEPDWMSFLLPALLDLFPKVGNTPKQVLMLHEVDTYLGLLKSTDDDDAIDKDGNHDNNDAPPAWWTMLLQVLTRCMASDHSRVAERALQFFQNVAFEQLVHQNFESALPLLLKALVQKEPPWNPTVRKMTFHILNNLRLHDETSFDPICNQVFAGHATRTSAVLQQSAEALPRAPPDAPPDHYTPQNHSLKAGMGSWRPPVSKSSRSKHHFGPAQTASMSTPTTTRQPPVTVTGVAPWATSSLPTASHSRPPLTAVTGTTTTRQPPITVTGVAPWVTSSLPTASQSKQPLTGTAAPWATPSGNTPAPRNKCRAGDVRLSETSELSIQQEQKTTEDEINASGAQLVAAYMQKIKPTEEDSGASSWSKAQLAETPTLLPKLKFHDLVFGHELGTGTFSSVKYARLIDRSKTRSHWAEYAVKRISTDTIRALSYEASVQREIAVLRLISHPGVARLVSSFRFREGAFLVLEYASRGDLHTLLQKHGSLDEPSTRFVIGEIASALASLHDNGLVFGDLKPENCVITETGHIKITDFGGCRPYTDEAKRLIRLTAKDVLTTLRSGDWKPDAMTVTEEYMNCGGENDKDNDLDGTDELLEEDIRIEGTTAYLPPEVVMGAIPTPAADSWALGCVMFQCLSGRPPLLDTDDDATRRRIVSFDVQETSGSDVDRIFEDSHASGISANARATIKSLLSRVASERPSMHELGSLPFFSCIDMFSLHQDEAHPLDAGQVSPVADAQWSRRQLSSIWSPQPAAYSVELLPAGSNDNAQSFGLSTTSPIAEGEEASASFVSSFSGGIHLPPSLSKVSENK